MALGVALFLFGIAFTAHAAGEPKRFLFIVDTSASMKPVEAAVSEALFDLVYSGVRGQMTNGDSYGIWLINEQNDTSFKMDVWKHKYAVESAARAAKHVKERGFRGKARLNEAFADAAVVIKNVEDLHLILISNGETPISGTPFDDIVNLRFREMAPHMKRAKATLNTAFVARDGQIVAWASNTPEFLIDVPQLPPKPPKTKVATAPTNVPTAGAVGESAMTQEPPKPRVASNPIIITRESVAQEKRTFHAMTSTAGNEASPASTTNIVSGPLLPLPTNSISLAATSSVVKPDSNNLVSTSIKATNIPITANAESTNASKADIFAAIPPAAIAVDSPANLESWLPIVWAGIGAGVAIVCLVGGFLLARGRRNESSLISRSIVQDRARAT